MKLYTKTGDDGRTGLIGGERVYKDDKRVACYGEVDELNAVIGLAVAAPCPPEWSADLQGIQSDLFILGAQLATPDGRAPEHAVDAARVEALERRIDAISSSLRPLKNFVLPGGSELAARFHHARTVCRRAERAVIDLVRSSHVDSQAMIYLNRLGDLLFAYALFANHRAGVENVLWKPA